MSLASTTKVLRAGHEMVQVFINAFPMSWFEKELGKKKLRTSSISAWLASKVGKFLCLIWMVLF